MIPFGNIIQAERLGVMAVDIVEKLRQCHAPLTRIFNFFKRSAVSQQPN